MIINRFEDAVAQKCRMKFYLKPGHKVWLSKHSVYKFCATTKRGVEFVGGLTFSDVSKLIANVVI